MERLFWLVLLFVVVSLRTVKEGAAFALGNTLGWVLIALVPTIIWWLITRNRGKWHWFNWLNRAVAIMAILVSASTLIGSWANVQIAQQQQVAQSPSPPAPTYDTKGWTEESTNSTDTGPWLNYDPPGTRYYRDANNIIYRLYPPGTKPNAKPANPFGLGDSSEQVPAPHPSRGEG